MTDLNRKMAKGAVWLILFRMFDRSIGFISTLILARVLIPADFGLVAMATAILAMVTMLSAFSFDVALIQNTQAGRRHYDTAWTFNILFGAASGATLLALSLPAAAYYGEPRMVGIMAALAANCALQGWGNIGVVAFQKDLELHKEFALGVAKRMVAFAVTTCLALLLRSYWALLAGTLAATATAVLLSYTAHPYRPRFSLQGRHDLFQFSKWMLLNNMLIAVCHRAPDFAIGRAAGATALGSYTVAYEISNLPTTELVFPISRAVFPGYAKLAGNVAALRASFLEVLALIVTVTLPAGLGIVVLAQPLVQVLLGDKWAASVPLIQILGLYGVLRAAGSNSGSVYLALGRPRILTYLSVLYLALLLPALWYWVPRAGASGAAQAVLFAAAIQVPLGFATTLRLIELAPLGLLAVVWRPVTAGAAMAATVTLLRHAWLAGAADTPALLQLLLLVPAGAAAYGFALLGLWALSGRPPGAETALLAAAAQLWHKARRSLPRLA